MMGHQQGEQAALFYEFSLERHVPPNHLLRSIDTGAGFMRQSRKRNFYGLYPGFSQT
ncbi:hypothetical protein J6524_15115 [Bradyrhizobium sp. WSM 1738]|uniref:hypothetical protein n=1 Tax=Bradyrhizobium hereditatis TaxID=2821405 RepID=UPI0035DC7186|nr:hypothetical protein [Bradyrhizobium hereditatis]